MARHGKGMDPAAGSRQLDPVFAQTSFRLDSLTRPTAFSDMGFDFGKVPTYLGELPSLQLLSAGAATSPSNVVCETCWRGMPESAPSSACSRPPRCCVHF